MAVCRREIEKALKPMLKYAYVLTNDSDRSCDLVQDCVVKALSTSCLPERFESYRPWLFSILRNCHIDELRKNRRRLQAMEETEGETGIYTLPVHMEETLINRLTVRGAIQRLPGPYREILALVDVAGFSYCEVADLLDIPAGTVMSRLSRARANLAREIDPGNVHALPRRNRKGRKRVLARG